jgi:hypothetical protein
MTLKRSSHLNTFAHGAASRPYWNRLTCFGIVLENSYNGPAVVDSVYLMTCKTWKGFDLPCLICVKIKLVEVDSSIQRRCLDGVCFLLRSASRRVRMPAFLSCREPAEAVHDVTTVQTTHAVHGH